MATGKVKWWNEAKGFGFIIPDDGSEDIFAHFSEVKTDDEFRVLPEGQLVEYTPRRSGDKLIAGDVRPVETDAGTWSYDEEASRFRSALREGRPITLTSDFVYACYLKTTPELQRVVDSDRIELLTEEWRINNNIAEEFFLGLKNVAVSSLIGILKDKEEIAQFLRATVPLQDKNILSVANSFFNEVIQRLHSQEPVDVDDIQSAAVDAGAGFLKADFTKEFSHIQPEALPNDELKRLLALEMAEEQTNPEEAEAKVEAQLRLEIEATVAKEAKINAEEEAKAKAAEEARMVEAKAEDETQRKADEQAMMETEAKAKAEKKARLEAEAKFAEEARIKVDEEAKAKVAEKARVAEAKAAEEAQRKADEQAMMEIEAKAKAEKKARLEAEAKFAEEARIKVDEEAKAKVAEKERVAEAKEAEEAHRKADEQTRMETEAKAKVENQPRLEAEGKAGAELAERTSAPRAKLIFGAVIATLLCSVGGSYWYFNKQETKKTITGAKQPEPVGANEATTIHTPLSGAATTAGIKQLDNNIPQPSLNESQSVKAQTAKVKPIAIPDQSDQEGASVRLNGILRNATINNWISVDSDIKKLRDVAPQSISSDMAGHRVSQDKGKQALNEHDYPNAIVYFSAAVDSSPNDAESLNGLGYALLRNRDIDKAEIIIKRALSLQPGSGAAWACASEVFAAKENSDASFAALKVAIHLSTNRQKTMDYLNNVVSKADSPKFILVIRKVLATLDSIPQVDLKMKGAT